MGNCKRGQLGRQRILNKYKMEYQMTRFKTSMSDNAFWILFLNALAWSCLICIWMVPRKIVPVLFICQTITVLSAIPMGIYVVIKYGGRKQWIGALGILLGWLNILTFVLVFILKLSSG